LGALQLLLAQVVGFAQARLDFILNLQGDFQGHRCNACFQAALGQPFMPTVPESGQTT
jgi:hypothetical protein